MFRIVLDHIHEPVKQRVDELLEADPGLDEKAAYYTILDAVESGAVTLDQLPDLTLEAKDGSA
jgi:hypothetical protein